MLYGDVPLMSNAQRLRDAKPQGMTCLLTVKSRLIDHGYERRESKVTGVMSFRHR